MGLLKRIGIVKSDTKSAKLFESLTDVPFFDLPQMLPHEYVRFYWERYKNTVGNKDTLNGQMFELIISTLFVRERLLPLYLQAQVAFVPNVYFDVLLYTQQQNPISFSLKTSLRERYKQADLEAIALKYVHRRAICYLLSLDENEVASVKKKIAFGDVIGLNKVVLCTSSEFDEVVNLIRSEQLIEAGNIDIITSSTLIRKNNLKQILG